MKLIIKAIDKCVLALAAIAGFILLLLLLAVCFATASRYLFNEPFSNLIDYSSYSLVFVAFLGAPWLMSKRGHINVDLLITMVSPKAQKYWYAALHFLMVIVSLIIAYVGTVLAADYFANNRVMQDIMNTPQWILLFPIPLGMFFLALQSLINAFEDLKAAKTASPIRESEIPEGGKV